MGLMDKVKAQATQLAHQGQAKLSEIQVRRQADALLRDLGAAVYGAQRQAGPHEPIEKAMAALDAHVAEHGPIDTTPGDAEPSTAATDTGPAGT
jgi:hypothetical protein